MKFLYTLILLAVASVTFAQDNIPIRIEADDSYPRDAKVVQTLGGMQDVEGQYRARWVVRSDDGRIDPDIRIHYQEHGVSIWCPPGKYETICTVAIYAKEPEELLWVDLQHEWIVEGEVNPPDDPDVPDDPDDPVDPPEGFDDVPSLVADLVRPIKDAEKVETCKILAEVYRKHGALARDGAYEDADELADACNAEYTYTLGINKFLRYRPAMTRVREAIGEMMSDGRLEDMESFGNLWVAIGDGFDLVKGGKDATVQD